MIETTFAIDIKDYEQIMKLREGIEDCFKAHFACLNCGFRWEETFKNNDEIKVDGVIFYTFQGKYIGWARCPHCNAQKLIDCGRSPIKEGEMPQEERCEIISVENILLNDRLIQKASDRANILSEPIGLHILEGRNIAHDQLKRFLLFLGQYKESSSDYFTLPKAIYQQIIAKLEQVSRPME